MKRWIGALLCLVILIGVLPTTVGATDISVEVPKDKEAVMAALYEADLASLRRAVLEGFVTSEELTAYYLDRIEAYDAPYNCFITICDDALEVAKERDAALAAGEAEGLLFGVPVVIKDNMNLTGFHTTNGYQKNDSQIAKSNADVVDALLAEGAVIIAKTNMSTAAMRAEYSKSEAVGETKNAYSSYLAAGGSSGGSAVATSLNFAAASLGTDTNSSLRFPAVLNGCVSLRPTFGTLSQKGIKRLNSKRDVPGAITRTVYDQAIMLDVLTDSAYNYTDNLNADALQGMRIGVLKELSYATTRTGGRTEAKIDDEVETAFAAAIQQMKACGAEVVEVSMPNIFTLSANTFGGETTAREPFAKAFEKLLEDNEISAVIFPTYLSAPHRSGKDENGKYWSVFSQTYISNTRIISPSAGIPELGLPIGYHSRGAGIGMEIAAPAGSEQLLLDIAYSFTEYKDHRVAPEGAPNDLAENHTGTLQEVIDGYYQSVEEAIRLEQERIEQERLEQERLEQERLEQERLEQERIEQERLEQARLEQERLERERIALEQQQMLILWICVGIGVFVVITTTVILFLVFRKKKAPVA